MDPTDVERAIKPPWRIAGETLQAEFLTRTMVAGSRFVALTIDAAEELNHHPDIDLRYATIHFELTTHSVGALTALDVELAERISQIARDLEIDPA